MRPKPDSCCLHRVAPGIWPRSLVPVALDPFPTSSKTAHQPRLGRSGILAADESETQPLLATNWTQPEHERRPRHFAAAVPDTPPAVRSSLASSYPDRVAPDRNSFAFQPLVSAYQPSAALLDQVFRHMPEQTHQSTASQTDAGVISADRMHAPEHVRNGR